MRSRSIRDHAITGWIAERRRASDTTLLEFHDEWARKRGLPTESDDIEGASFATLSGGVQVGTTTIAVHATLRVPADSVNKLPEVSYRISN